MGFVEIVAEYFLIMDYIEQEDWLMGGFYSGKGVMNASYQVYYNIFFFIDLFSA